MARLTWRLGRLASLHPWRTLAIWLGLLVAVSLAAQAMGSDFADDVAAPGSDSDQAHQLLEDNFPEMAGGRATAVFAARDGSLDADEQVGIAASLERIRGLAKVNAVIDPFAANTVSHDGRIAFAEIVFDVPDSDIGTDTVHELVDALEPARAAGLDAEAGGSGILLNSQPETSSAEAVGILAALIVLAVALGTLTAAIVPVGLAVVAVGVGVAVVAMASRVVTVSSDGPTIATMIGLGVGIDYALFIVARYREQRRQQASNEEALQTALATTGPAVAFAGGTVVVAMAGLALTGLGVLTSIGLATSFVVLTSVAAALTLLPAVLTLLGSRIDRGAVFRRLGRAETEGVRWNAFAHRVSARPWPYLLGSAALLFFLAAPMLDMELSFPDAGTEPTSTTHRRAHDLLTEGFGPGFNGPLLTVVDLARHDDETVAHVRDGLAADAGISAVTEPVLSRDGGTALISAIPTTGPADRETSETIARLRRSIGDEGVHLGGVTAAMDDMNHHLERSLPTFVGAIVLVSFLLLMMIFRSVLVSAKAALMNLLSIGSAYGVMVAVFQWGWGAALFGLEGPVPIVSFIPILMFAGLFGLSMDYEVFLLSRIREEHVRTADNAESVARGLAGTGRVITSAALIMICVFLSFVANPSPMFKMVGLGLATAIAIDASVVRMVLVPATMAVMGRANWWLPRWLDRILPSIEIDGPQHALGREAGAPDDLAVEADEPLAGTGAAV